MLLNIPDVINTQGTTTNITYAGAGPYNIPNGWYLLIKGRIKSGSLVDGEDFTQVGTGFNLSHFLYKNGEYLIGASAGSTTPANATADYVGGSSGAIFTPSDTPVLAPNMFIYIDPLFGRPYTLVQSNTHYTSNGVTFTLAKAPPSGSVMKMLICKFPTFQMPPACRSATLRNISGADMYVRAYVPDSAGTGNVIGTPGSGTNAEIVGQLIKDGELLGFVEGDFTQGATYMLAADSAGDQGAIVEFYY